MKKLKIIFTLALVWMSVNLFPSAKNVEAENVTITTNKSSITMNNASWKGTDSLEVSIKNQPIGSTMVITLGNNQVVNFFSSYDDEKELFDTYSFTKKASTDEDEEEEDDGIYIDLFPLTVGESSVNINVYSAANEVLATATIPVVVNSITPELHRIDYATNKIYNLAQTSNWTCEVGNWSSGAFRVCNVPYGSKVTLSVDKKKMYKRTSEHFLYKWKKMKRNSYVLQEDTYATYWKDNNENYDFILCPQKAGSASITVTVETGGNVTTFVIKNKVEAYKNPLEKLVINGKDKTKAFNKEQYLQSGTNLESSSILDIYNTDKKEITGQIKMKKGYKLISVKNGKKKIKLRKSNGTYYFTVKKSKLRDLKITYKNKKGKTRYLYNLEL